MLKLTILCIAGVVCGVVLISTGVSNLLGKSTTYTRSNWKYDTHKK